MCFLSGKIQLGVSYLVFWQSSLKMQEAVELLGTPQLLQICLLIQQESVETETDCVDWKGEL